jgi:hypothetical protein
MFFWNVTPGTLIYIVEKVRVTYREAVKIMLTAKRPSGVGFINSLVILMLRCLRF